MKKILKNVNEQIRIKLKDKTKCKKKSINDKNRINKIIQII